MANGNGKHVISQPFVFTLQVTDGTAEVHQQSADFFRGDAFLKIQDRV